MQIHLNTNHQTVSHKYLELKITLPQNLATQINFILKISKIFHNDLTYLILKINYNHRKNKVESCIFMKKLSTLKEL